MTPSDNLQLLLTHADEKSNEPVLKQGLSDAALLAAKPANVYERLSDRRAQSERPDDLPLQRWGLVVPDGELGDRLLGAIAPLIRQRQYEQEGISPSVFRVPGSTAMSLEAAQRWRDQVYDELDKPPEDRMREEDQPAFLLVLGDLHQVPETVHQVLGSDCYVGRLAFSTPQGEPDFQRYEAYVDKVLRWERKPSPSTRAQTRFCVVDDGTSATTLGRLALVQPALLTAKQDLELGKFPAADLRSVDAVELTYPSSLLSIGGESEPTVLLSLSHGTGAPRGGWQQVETQRLLQGAMSFGEYGRLTGKDLGQHCFLPGGVWFMLACYSAGTPSESCFTHWLKQLRAASEFSGNLNEVIAGLPKAGDRPFIAALPQAVLGNPEGPLAFMGHLDLAWTYSFHELKRGTARSRPARFLNLVKSLIRHHRVGVAFRELTRYVNNINLELTALIDRSAATGAVQDAAQLGHLWMLRQDLMGYVLLGDPAVRLPLAAERRTA